MTTQPGDDDALGGLMVRYDAMCRSIDEAHRVDEVKDIHDKALALEAYAKQAKDHDAERKVTEIRLRAERRCGQLLRERDKAKGATEPGTNRGLTRSHDETASPKTLSDLRISKAQSSRWQKLANIPKAQFEASFAKPDAKPSTAGIIKGHQRRATMRGAQATPAPPAATTAPASAMPAPTPPAPSKSTPEQDHDGGALQAAKEIAALILDRPDSVVDSIFLALERSRHAVADALFTELEEARQLRRHDAA
jgi:hypothetical protein